MHTRTRAASTISLNGDEPLGEDEPAVGCKAAVEIVSRNSQKGSLLRFFVTNETDASAVVSYDINKDGYMVATLTLVKSAYRLGETVNGSVVINSGDGRVLRVGHYLPYPLDMC